MGIIERHSRMEITPGKITTAVGISNAQGSYLIMTTGLNMNSSKKPNMMMGTGFINTDTSKKQEENMIA